jgi:hypothetical protein
LKLTLIAALKALRHPKSLPRATALRRPNR